jgi:hypothetical protein
MKLLDIDVIKTFKSKDGYDSSVQHMVRDSSEWWEVVSFGLIKYFDSLEEASEFAKSI